MNKLVLLMLITGITAYAQCPAAMSTLTASVNLSTSVDSKICGLSGAGTPTASWCTTALIGKARYVNTSNGDTYDCTANLTWTLKGATGPTGPTGATGATGPTGPTGPAGGGGSGSGVSYCAPSSASATTYTCAPSPTVTYAAGVTLAFVPDVTSGTTPTVNVNGGGAKSIKLGDASTAVPSGFFIAGIPGKTYLLVYDGTNFVYTSQETTAVKVASTGSCLPVFYTNVINYNNAALTGTSPVSIDIITGLTGDFIPEWVKIRERTQFVSSDATLVALTSAMGRSTNTTTQQEWIPAFSLMSAAAPQNTWVDRPMEPTDGLANTYTMSITFTQTASKNLNTLTAGVLVWEVKGCFLGVAQ